MVLPESARAVVCVMARRPGGRVTKTRLAARLDDASRSHLYEAFLRDKLAQIAELRDVHLAIAVAPPDDAASMEPWTPAGATVIVQRGDDLGARLDGVACALFAAGARAVVMTDSDTPTLPTGHLEEAVRALASGTVDVVYGPAQDGGYYLVGLRRPEPTLFTGIVWSTPSVLAASLRAADAAALRVHLLPSWYDIDEPADLDRLVAELRTTPRFAPGFPHATARALATTSAAAAEPSRDEHWRTRSKRPVYTNRWIDVSESVVTLPSGHVTLYGIVRTAPCVGVLPLAVADMVLLVRQFRYVARRFTWEIPTGGAHAGETLADAARRELREEAGVEALTLRPLLSFDTSKSVVDETAHLFVAEVDGSRGPSAPAAPDATEQIERRLFALDEAYAMVDAGEIVDSMSVIALLAVRARGRR